MSNKTIELNLNSAQPNKPLPPMFTDGQTVVVKLFGLPQAIGAWHITNVRMRQNDYVHYAQKSGNCWKLETSFEEGLATVECIGKDENNRDFYAILGATIVRT